MTQNIKNFATNQLVSLGTQGLQRFVGNIPGLTSVSGNRTSTSPQARLNNFSTRGVTYYMLKKSIKSCCFMGNGR